MGRFSRKLLSAAVALSVVISGIGIVPAYAEGESEPEEAVSNTEPAPVGTDGEGDSAEEATIDTIVVYGEEQSVSHDYNGLSNDELMAYYVQRMIDDSLASPYSRPAMDYGGLSECSLRVMTVPCIIILKQKYRQLQQVLLQVQRLNYH